MAGPTTSATRQATPTRKDLAAIVQLLQPVVAARFAGQDVAGLPRQSLALKIGEIAAAELDGVDHGLNLIERRALISELIDDLLAATAKAAPAASLDTSDGTMETPAWHRGGSGRAAQYPAKAAGAA